MIERVEPMIRLDKPMDKITEVRIEEVKDFEENRHFWRIYYTKNERIIILGESRVKPQLTRVVAIYKWKK